MKILPTRDILLIKADKPKGESESGLLIAEKICTKCDTLKPETEFYWDKSYTRYRADCKRCQNDATKKRYSSKEAIEKRLLSNRIYHKREAEKVAERKRHYYKENREQILEYHHNWLVENANTDEYKAKRAFHNKRWKQNNPVQVRLNHHKRRAQTTNKVVKEEITNWLSKICGICSEYIETSFHIDHILPLSRGGLHEASNLQLAHPVCNLKKNKKTQEEYLCNR